MPVHPDGQEICRATEKSLPIALFAAGSSWCLSGCLVGLAAHPVRLRVHPGRPGDRDQPAAALEFADVYDIDASADTERALDRRLLLATTVGMDALQAR